MSAAVGKRIAADGGSLGCAQQLGTKARTASVASLDHISIKMIVNQRAEIAYMKAKEPKNGRTADFNSR